MKRILSFGAGVQTTALAILVAQDKVLADGVVFADTGAEKPETYWYMENYTKPLLKEARRELITVRSELKSRQPDLYGFLWRHKDIPNPRGNRQCSVDFKRLPIRKAFPHDVIMVGFSFDEQSRAKQDSYPLIEASLTGSDCIEIIRDYGWPIPCKSSCFFCPFQRPDEWQWLKRKHLDLFEKALALESRFYERKANMRNDMGLYGGRPLWHFAQGRQDLLFDLQENSCWDGACGH